MLDIGWSELVLIGVVALIVVGPKDLPDMFRTLGRLTSKARMMARDFQRAMESAADESGLKDVSRDLRNMTSPTRLGLDKINSTLDDWENRKAGVAAETAGSTPGADPAPAAEPAAQEAATTAPPEAPVATPAVVAEAPVSPAQPKRKAVKRSDLCAGEAVGKSAAPKAKAKAPAVAAAAPVETKAEAAPPKPKAAKAKPAVADEKPAKPAKPKAAKAKAKDAAPAAPKPATPKPAAAKTPSVNVETVTAKARPEEKAVKAAKAAAPRAGDEPPAASEETST